MATNADGTKTVIQKAYDQFGKQVQPVTVEMTCMKICCTSILDHTDCKSPFDRVIDFSYYDGAKSGIARCRTCGNEYLFELLSWDANQGVRIYGLSLVDTGSFEKITVLAEKFDVPRWPEWCPILKDKKLAAEQTVLKDAINELISAKGPITFVIATEGLTQKINFARKVVAGDLNVPPLQERLDQSAFLEWRKFLGDKK